MGKKKQIKYNLIFSITSQLIILALGIVIPRLVLVSYGSEINGLLTTVTQIFTYVALLESGIGNASVNALYQPIVEKDTLTISEIYWATKKYYEKITVIYFICVILLAIMYPLVITTTLGYFTVFLLIFFEGMSGVILFWFVAALKQVLIADGRNYVIANISVFVKFGTSFAKIIIISLGFSVVWVQFAYFVVNCFQIMIYTIYFLRKYQWIVKIKNPSMKYLSQRNAFIIHEISGVVFSSTDAFVLSTFCSLAIASVYSIYNLVFSSLFSLISSINSGLFFILGQTYAKGLEKYKVVHDAYDSLYMALVFALMSVAYIMIMPFINLYTEGINDADYFVNGLPLLFTLIQLLSCSRAVSSRLISIAGHAKATQNRSILETIINITVSVILVNLIGIYGVLIGTIVALLYRTNDMIIYANKKILKRSPWATYKKMLVNFFVFGVIVFVNRYLSSTLLLYCNSYFRFIEMAIPITIFSCLLYCVIALMQNQDIIGVLKVYVHRKRDND